MGSFVRRVAVLVVVGSVIAPVLASAKLIPDRPLTPVRTPVGSRALFTGLLPAPAGDAFFIPPSPLPGNPGDVIWAEKSSSPSSALMGPSGASFPLRPIAGTTRRADVWRIMFHSTNRVGDSVPGVALVVFDPLRHVGAPLVIGMHGAVGLGDRCGVFGNERGASISGANGYLSPFVDAGSVVVIPDGPGTAVPGLATPLITSDSTRHLIDSAYAAQQLTGAALTAQFHGHSLGGTMVYGVAAEAVTYAPSLVIQGSVAHQPGGIVGPNSPFVDTSVGKAARSSSAMRNFIFAAMQTEAAYGKKVAGIERSLTPLGVKIARRSEQHCNQQMDQEVVVLKWDQVVQRNVNPWFDPGPLRPTASPLLMVVTQSDETADPLYQWHAYDQFCALGRPMTWLEIPGDHLVSIRTGDPGQLAVQAGMRAFLQNPNASACAAVSPMMAKRFTYTISYVANALGIVPGKGQRIAVKANGVCVVRGQLIAIRGVGTCTLTASTVGRGKPKTRTVEARVLG